MNYKTYNSQSPIIRQETWDNMSDEDKENLRNYHKWLHSLPVNNVNASAICTLENICGKENLQPKPKIKTWADMEQKIHAEYGKLDLTLGTILPTCKDDKLRLKIKATYKIGKLIELAYGGVVTEEEWKNVNFKKYGIICSPYNKELSIKDIWNKQCFISFHTKQQAEEFMSYPENRALIDQYNMI